MRHLGRSESDFIGSGISARRHGPDRVCPAEYVEADELRSEGAKRTGARHRPTQQVVVRRVPALTPVELLEVRSVVRQAREADGCLDFAPSPDLVDPRRINVYERWTDEQAFAHFRGSRPSDDQNDAIQGRQRGGNPGQPGGAVPAPSPIRHARRRPLEGVSP